MTSTSGTAAFRHREFRLFQAARLISTLGMQMQSIAVGWQLYAITGRPLDLGYAGLAQFLPVIGFSLVTGHAADRFDRRRILMITHAVLALCALAMLTLTLLGHPNIWLIYGVLFLFGTARAFAGPAGQALLPNLVPDKDLPNAVAWSSTIWHIAVVAGPALGGVIFGALGAAFVYGIYALIEGATLLLLRLMRTESRVPSKEGISWGELAAGLGYVWKNKVLLGAISLDLFAVLLGGATALLPIFARDILHIGPWGMGILRSAPAVGATFTALALAHRPLPRPGAAMFIGVAVFGASTIVFALSTSFVLSFFALLIAGAGDMVSVYVRHSLVLLNTPDDMRGRVAAVNLIFIGASNELGEFESGTTAEWWGPVRAVMIGGIGTCVVVALWAWRFPQLRRADVLRTPDPPVGLTP